MIGGLLKAVFGSANDRLVKGLRRRITAVNDLEPAIQTLSDDELREKTAEFRVRLVSGTPLDDLIPEAFAVVREAAKRVLGQRHYDVQLIGGLALHQGMIAEMKTGEGKTLVATLAVYVNALSGKGVHVVTVNDYLARRDSEWMGAIYRFLGLEVGCIVHGLSEEERRRSYHADITYGTNHEFGFDYLRDNMKFQLSERVMRPFNYAIVDEVDSILIDEARTPLIISGPAEDSSALYQAIDRLIPTLIEGHYEKDEKQKSTTLTETGVECVEKWLVDHDMIHGSLYDVHNMAYVHHVNAALRAHKMYQRDVDYIVMKGEVVLIDEFTGRMMDGRRYSDGLHQAIEAKEGVKVQTENQTLASITYQNYFRLYPKLAGMAGTAATEASEFEEIYKLRVIEIPTHVPVTRKDMDDDIYLTFEEKYRAILNLIRECVERRQPVLVGTTSIERNEFLSALLKRENIQHQVLNARYHDQEAVIVSNAGRLGAVTVATNMAGRGTDIKLGGSVEARIMLELAHMQPGAERDIAIDRIKQEVEEEHSKVITAGGLFVIGTERHESRRIDNQLRGRSGRQGDPGASKFFICLQDDLMRIFGSNRMEAMLRKLGAEENEAISHKWINKAIERAQQKVEARNFDIRKHLLRYDDVMNDQRKIVYEQRLSLMEHNDIREVVDELCDDVVEQLVHRIVMNDTHPDEWNIEALHADLLELTGHHFDLHSWREGDDVGIESLISMIKQVVVERRQQLDQQYSEDLMRRVEGLMMLRLLDQSWKDHLLTLDHLRQGINLRSYAQSNPVNEYKREAFNLFENMLNHVRTNFVRSILHFRLDRPDENMEEIMWALLPRLNFEKMAELTPDWVGDESHTSSKQQEEGPATRHTRQVGHVNPQDPSTWGRVSRNAVCPCGSGKKFKHCHGMIS